MNAGFFKLKRSFFSHWLWDEERVYNRGEAFLDLLQLAAFAPTKRIVKDQLIQVPIGGVIASERFLAVRWKWSRNKVRHFLHLLKEDKMLDQRKDQGQTVLILCNYERHAACQTTEGPLKGPDEDQLRTSEGPNKKKVKKEKKDSSVETQAIAWSATGGWSGITEDDLSAWREAYPACDIKRQLAVMTEWLKGNPARAKKSQWRRFVTNWLSRSQDRGGDTKSNLTPHKPQPNMQL